jgi:hypothetical protein
LGRERPDVARSLNNLASLHQVLSRTADALPLTEKTLAGDRAQLRVALPVLQAGGSPDN